MTTLITREDVKRYQGRHWFRRAMTMVSTGGQRVITMDGRALNTLEELQAEDAPAAIEPTQPDPKPTRQRYYGVDRKNVRVHARMTEDYRKRFIALGGSTWLRKQIDAALPQLNA